MKVVLDANVLIAAFGSRGVCEAVFAVCARGHHRVFVSAPVTTDVLEHLVGKFHATPSDVAVAMASLGSVCETVEPVPVPREACRDPDDTIVLGTAMAARADCIVTGDKDLLVLGTYQGIAILSPRDFYTRFC